MPQEEYIFSNEIGVMQGRLLPKYLGRYQAHPVGYWQKEFYVASQLGLDCIEFILDFNDAQSNPLLRDGGVDEIHSVAYKADVSVRTICADYFMTSPIHSDNRVVARESQQTLTRIIGKAAELGATEVVVPCVDESSLVGKKELDRFIQRLLSSVDVAEDKGVNLSLETDLNPESFGDLLERIGSDRVTVNYDIGNSASLGYDPVEELSVYGEKVTDIHIKDRELGGGSVILGEGNADFSSFFGALKKFDYKGPLIMQAYRDDQGIDIFRKQLEWIKNYLPRSI